MTHFKTYDGAGYCRAAGNGLGDHEVSSPEHAFGQRPGRRSSDATGDGAGWDIDPALAQMADEFSLRTLAGEIVDIDELIAAHPEQAEAFRNLLPLLQELGRSELIENGEAGADSTGNPSSARRAFFADFEIVREIGRGGMGIVYEASQSAIGRRVALKVLPMAAAMDSKALQRFQLEAKVAGLLQHRHIVPVHAVGTSDGVPYFAMQYIEGGSLAGLIAELRGLVDRGADQVIASSSGDSPSALALGLLTGRFEFSSSASDGERSRTQAGRGGEPVSATTPQSIRGRTFHRTVARLGIQIAEALGYAHDQGIVHRDVKPANLLLDQRGDVWVADFGMADVQGDAGLTLTGDLPGTLRYMSPEQAAGKRALIDRRTDVYSLGATLYELLTLQPAIVGSDRAEIIRRIAEEEPEPLRRLNPAVPVDLATIVIKALSKEPAKRYETAQDLGDDLARFLEGRPIAARPVGPIARSWRWCRRKPVQAGQMAALVLALVGGFTGITVNWWKAQNAERRALTQAANAAAAEKEARTQAANAAAAEKEARAQSARADAINRFLIDKLIGQATPYKHPNPSGVTLRAAIDRAAADVGRSFQDQPTIEVAIRTAIGHIYHELGDYSKSEVHHRAAYAILGNGSGKLSREAIESMLHLGDQLMHLGRLNDAEPLIREALTQARRLLGAEHKLTLEALQQRAKLHFDRGQFDEAAALRKTWFEQSKLALGPRHPTTIGAMDELGLSLLRQGKDVEAECMVRESVNLSRDVLGPEHPDTLVATGNLAVVLHRLGRGDEAEPLFRQCLAAKRRVFGPEHPRTLNTAVCLGSLLYAAGRLDEAEALFKSTLESMQRVLGANHEETVAIAQSLEKIRKQRAVSRESPRP